MGNGNGGYRTTPERTMRAYDALPAILREAHRNAIFYWATQPDLTALKRGVSDWLLRDELITHDVAAVRKDARQDWHAQANDYVAAQRQRRPRDYLDRPPRSRL